MPRPSTIPTLFDEVKQIHLSNLIKWGYLQPGRVRHGILTWSRNGQQTGSISICVNMFSDTPFIELDYKYRESPINYTIPLVWLPSNLGKGKIWYFECPQTHKKCLKLYSVGAYFLHREAFKGVMYDSQVKSKYYRELDRKFRIYFEMDKLYKELQSKNFKKFYAGKLTKQYIRIMTSLKQASKISQDEIERIFIK